MGRKTGKKKRGAAKNTKVPKAAPLVDATVFGGSYSLKVPQGWMHPAEVLASGLDARPSEQFVSRRALSSPGFATLMVDLGARPRGWGSGDQRLMEFLRFHEAENDVTFDSAYEFKCRELPFERAWSVEYRSVGKLQGRTTETTAILLESPEADMILRLNNGDTENVSFPSIVGSLRRNSKIPLPPANPAGSAAAAEALSRLPVPQTIELDFDELEAVAKVKGLDINFLWMVAQAVCFSDAELASMDAAAHKKADDLLGNAAFRAYRLAALDLPGVRRRFEDVQRAHISTDDEAELVATAELAAVAKDRNLDLGMLQVVALAMCLSAAETASLDTAVHEKFTKLGPNSATSYLNQLSKIQILRLRGDVEFEEYRQVALEMPAVRRRIEDERREALGCIEDMKRARAASEKGPSQAASEPVDDPRARALEVAAAVCEAAIRAIPPGEDFTKNARWIRSVQNLRDAIITDESDGENFYEYMQSQKYDGPEPERMVKFMTRWPRLRKYWPRLRRRICSYCGAYELDLSTPRFLVCGGCAEGPGVGRYCSENCQREDWPEHQNVCPLIHHMPAEEHPWLRKMQNSLLIEGMAQAKSAGLSPEDYYLWWGLVCKDIVK